MKKNTRRPKISQQGPLKEKFQRCCSHRGSRVTEAQKPFQLPFLTPLDHFRDDVPNSRESLGPVPLNRVKYESAAVQHIELPDKQFVHMHVDLVGPLPVSKSGCTHLFTIIDRAT
jgi:hypothetical protein